MRKRIFFALEVKIILWPLTSISHILTVSNQQICSDDQFDLWPFYVGARFRVSRPSCYYMPIIDTVLELLVLLVKIRMIILYVWLISVSNVWWYGFRTSKFQQWKHPLVARNKTRDIKCCRVITFKNGILFEKKVYDKQIINTVTWSDTLFHVHF